MYEEEERADGGGGGGGGRAFYRVNTCALAKLCGCSSHAELVYALRRSGQAVSGERAGAGSTVRQDAEALLSWYKSCELPSPPLVNVAVVSTASRPGPLDTPSKPKVLLRVGDATLLSHCLRGICRAGVRHVVLVLGGLASNAIAKHVEAMRWHSYFATLRIVDLGSEYSSGHAASLLAAARVLLGPTQAPRPFLLVGVDHVYHHDILRKLVDTPYFEDDGPAGVVLVETQPRIIERLRAAAHSTAVRVVVGERDENDPSQWVREIGRYLEDHNGVEAGAFVLTTRVFDALRGLARAAPYFTLAEALSKFCGKDTRSRLRAMNTAGLPWIAIETADQHLEASVVGSDLLRFGAAVPHDKPPRRIRGVAIRVEVARETDRIGVFETYADRRRLDRPAIVELEDLKQQQERREDTDARLAALEREELPVDKRIAQRKISSSSLAALVESYEDEEDEEELDARVAERVDKHDHSRPFGVLGMTSEAPSHAAMAIFHDDDDDGGVGMPLSDDEDSEESPSKRPDDEGPAYRPSEATTTTTTTTTAKTKRRRLIPRTDIEHLRVRVFTTTTSEQPKLAVRVERRVPVFGWIILVAACSACASTSAFERSLPEDVSGALRSLWRQSVTTFFLALVEVSRPYLHHSSSSTTRKREKLSARFCFASRLRRSETDATSDSLLDPRERLAVFAGVVAGFSAQNLALCVALLFVPTAMALTLCNATPLWLVARSVLFTAKPSHRLVIVGALVGFLGAVILCTAELEEEASGEEDKEKKNPIVGVVVGAAGGLGGAVYVTAAKRAKGVPPTQLLLFANAGAVVLSLLIVVAQSSSATRRPFDPVRGVLGWTAPRNLVDSLFLSIVVDGVGILGILLALKYHDPLVVTVALLLEPVLAAIVDAAFGVGTLDSMSAGAYVGTFVVITGCAIVVTTSASSQDDIDASQALEPMSKDRRRDKSRSSSHDDQPRDYATYQQVPWYRHDDRPFFSQHAAPHLFEAQNAGPGFVPMSYAQGSQPSFQQPATAYAAVPPSSTDWHQRRTTDYGTAAPYQRNDPSSSSSSSSWFPSPAGQWHGGVP